MSLVKLKFAYGHMPPWLPYQIEFFFGLNELCFIVTKFHHFVKHIPSNINKWWFWKKNPNFAKFQI
jgi:hypothetical protein